SLDAISDNPKSIRIEANINKTQIDMRDIRYFVPNLQEVEAMQPLLTKTFYIDGKVSGRVDNLHIPRLEFKTLANTHIIASADIRGLPDVDRMHIDLEVDKLTSSKRDLDQLIA